MSVSELSVIIKNEEKRLTKKYLMHDPFVVTEHDPQISQCISESLKEFNDEATDVNVKITMCVR